MTIYDYGFKDSFNNNDAYIPARIISTARDRYRIICKNGISFARLKQGSYYDNPNSIYPTIGDFVLIDWNNTGDSRIIETLKRETSLSRTDPSPDGQHEQFIAANFDYIFIIQSLNNNFNIHRLERYLTLSFQSGATPIIILTKCDLVSDFEIYLDKINDIAPDVSVHVISAKTGYGIATLNKYFKPQKTIVLLGSSGVGKSTLINTLVGYEVMNTSEIREEDSRGRHTTTNRELIMLKNGTMLIDTPGMREVGMWDITDGLDKTFSDVEKYIGTCKFSNCTHTNEPGCKILQAIEEGNLSLDRFNSYIKLKKEAKYTDDSESYLKEKRAKFKEISKYSKKLKY